MKRFQKISALVLALCLALAATGALAVSDERVYDRADLFTAAEEKQIRSAIADFQKATNMDFVVLTNSDEQKEDSQQQIADNFYDKGGFGTGAEKSGALFYIDMYNRQEYLSTTGAMIDYITDSRLDAVLDVGYTSLHAGDYAEAVLNTLAKVQSYVKAGIPKGQYRYDVVTGQVLTARHHALTGTEMLVGALICLGIGLVFTVAVQARYKLKGSTYHYDYADNATVEITESRDDYLRTTVTRVPKGPPPGQGGGGFGGGGSGVHMGGGGVSHGGGGRGF
ncbi:MAG TPA: TPM domain-containing protein [Candidatus Limiplasma sp.]|nr:TPM domain-containing protein [Candidatus Limiplasma sp.]HPR78111.1 TPM domain-containing protein [Candidatus Limiplasma sp.]